MGGISVLERFVLSEDQSRLDYRLTITAAVCPIAPVTPHRHGLAPGGERQDDRCVVG